MHAPTANLVNLIMVYESLLLWPPAWISVSLAIVFFFVAFFNVVFTSFIAYEQLTMFYRELFYKEESIRLTRFLKLKDRPLLSKHGTLSNRKIELSYTLENSSKGKTITISVLMLTNLILSEIPYMMTQIIVSLVGSFTSPMVIFMLPGYLFYDHARTTHLTGIHRCLSRVLLQIGILLLLGMTCITFYVIRVNLEKVDDPKYLP